jgi:hypothetical protein
MSRKGHFLGGGTTIGSRDPTWFKKGSMRTPPDVTAPKPPLSPAEEVAFQALKESRESGSRLIPRGGNRPLKKRLGKTKRAKPKPSAVKPERSEPNRAVTEIHQAQRHGRSRKVAVEFVPKGTSKPA